MSRGSVSWVIKVIRSESGVDHDGDYTGMFLIVLGMLWVTSGSHCAMNCCSPGRVDAIDLDVNKASCVGSVSEMSHFARDLLRYLQMYMINADADCSVVRLTRKWIHSPIIRATSHHEVVPGSIDLFPAVAKRSHTVAVGDKQPTDDVNPGGVTGVP